MKMASTCKEVSMDQLFKGYADDVEQKDETKDIKQDLDIDEETIPVKKNLEI